MTYFSKSKTYEITAFSEADLLKAGDKYLNCGDTFTMPAAATTCIMVTDSDRSLSGDCRDNALGKYGQTASIIGSIGQEIGNGCQIYAEQYFWVKDQHGNKYVLIEIEQEGTKDDYYTFWEGLGVAPAGAELTVLNACNVKGDWVKYDCLSAGEKAPATGTISGTVWCDEDCDGIQDAEIVVTKGDPIFTSAVTYESVTCTTYNVDCYGDWRSVGKDTIDLIVGSHKAHSGNASDNTIVDLDVGGIWKRKFDVDSGGDYHLSFDVYKNDRASASDNSFDVVINGTVVETVQVTADGTIELTVELDAGANSIAFVSNASGHKGAGLDNVNFAPLIEERVASEMGKAGVVIKLLDATGAAVLDENGQPITTVTDADGAYSFENVPVGDY